MVTKYSAKVEQTRSYKVTALATIGKPTGYTFVYSRYDAEAVAKMYTEQGYTTVRIREIA